MKWEVTADPERFDEAVDWFLKRTVVTADEAERMNTDLRQRAFWIGGGLELDQVQRVFDKLGKAIETGESFEDWRKRVKGELANDAHAETVFRNAIQRALNAGRYRQMKEPGVAQFRPYWMFDAILDDRITDICEDRNKTVLPQDHPFWQRNIPPLHHRCRSSIRNLRKSEAQRRGITNVPPPDSPPEGFGLAPDIAPTWKPDPKKYDPELYKELEKKETKPAPKPKKPKTPPKEHDPAHWEQEFEPQYGQAAASIGWGRAMLERGMDRSGLDVHAELERLQKAGHPALKSVGLDVLKQVGNRPLRKQAFAQHGQWAALIALQEHTRTIKPGEFELPLYEDGPFPPAAATAAKQWYELMLDESVVRPTGRVLESFTVEDGARAHYGPGMQRIQLGDGTEKGAPVAVHEFAHAIEEANPRTLARSVAFLRARTKGEAFKKLSELTGNPGFEDWEEAKPDKFFSPYVGKDYGERATEITSMGYERLTWNGPWQLQWFADRDPEMLWFLLGQLAGR